MEIFQEGHGKRLHLQRYVKPGRRLIHGNAEALTHAALFIADGEDDVARLITGLHDDDELAIEETHGGLGEGLQRGGVAVAHGAEGASTTHVEGELILCVGDERAFLVDK